MKIAGDPRCREEVGFTTWRAHWCVPRPECSGRLAECAAARIRRSSIGGLEWGLDAAESRPLGTTSDARVFSCALVIDRTEKIAGARQWSPRRLKGGGSQD